MATHALNRPLHSARLLRTVIRAAAIAVSCYGAAVFVVAPLLGHFTGEFEDFAAYLGAAQASAAHTDIYAAFTHQTQNVALSGFDYPPVVAWLLTPLALVPVHAAATVFLIADVAATVLGAIVVARTLLPQHWPRVELALLASFLFAPAAYNYWHGQMNPVVFLLLALALQGWVQGKELRCGALIGAAAALKLAPVVLLVMFVRRGWWRGAAAAFAVLALSVAGGVIAFGWHTTAGYVQSVLPVLTRDDGWLYNQSWSGVVNRAAAHSVLTFQGSAPVLRAVAWALSATTIAVTAWSVRRRSADGVRRGTEFGAAVAGMTLAGTITWYAQDVHVLIPMAAAAGLLWTQRRNRLLRAALVASLLATAVVAPLLIAGATMPEIVAASHSALWWPLLQLASLPALGTAVLFVALSVALRGTDDQRAGAAETSLTSWWSMRMRAGRRWSPMQAGHVASDQACEPRLRPWRTSQ